MKEKKERREAREQARGFEESDRKCSSAIQSLNVGKRLGKGSYKVVFELCKDKDCKEPTGDVLQVVLLESERNLKELRKEVTLIKQVQEFSAKHNLRPMVLPIKYYEECAAESAVDQERPRKAFVIQARAAGTMEDLGTKQAVDRLTAPVFADFLKKYDVLWFTVDQMVEAFGLAKELYTRYGGLLHGDLKPDNVFVANGKFYLGDFGQSGALRGTWSKQGTPRSGFSANYGCPKQPPSSAQLRQFFNVWQLELLLRSDCLTVVEFPSNVAGLRTLRLFNSVDDLGQADLVIPPIARAMLDGACTKIDKDMIKQMKVLDAFRQAFASVLLTVFDPKVATEISYEQATQMSTQFYATNQHLKQPTWARFLMREGVKGFESKANWTPEVIDQMADPKIGNSITPEQAVQAAVSFYGNRQPEYAQLPSWVRYLIRQGLARTMALYRIQTVYLPMTPSPSLVAGASRLWSIQRPYRFSIRRAFRG